MTQENTIIAEVSPSTVWETIAKSNRKHTIIGYGGMNALDNLETVVTGLSTLFKQGAVQHLGLDRSEATWGDLTQAFMNASQEDRESQDDVYELKFAMGNNINFALPRETIRAVQQANFMIFSEARTAGAQIHYLSDEEKIYEQLKQNGVSPQVIDCIAEMKADPLSTLRFHWQDPRRELSKLFDQLDCAHDVVRAQRMKDVVGETERSAIVYEQAHLLGDNGLLHYLSQQEQQVHVTVTGFPSTAVFADFAVMEDNKTAYVTSRAQKRGLWPS